MRDDGGIRRQVFDVRPIDVCGFNISLDHRGDCGCKRRNGRPVNIGFVDVGGGNLSLGDRRYIRSEGFDLRPLNIGVDDIGCGQLRGGNHGDGRIELVRRDAACSQFLNLRCYRIEGIDVEGFDQGLGDMSAGNCGGLDMGALDGGILDLQRANRAGLQLACAHGIDGEFCASDAARRQLPG